MLKKILDIIKKDNQRSIRNYMLDSNLQMRLAIYVGFNLLVAVAGATYFVIHMHDPLFDTLIRSTDSQLAPQIFEQLSDNTRETVKIIGAFGIFYAVLIGMLIVWFSHRMIGPIVAFKRHINALKQGNFAARVKLRKHDAFTDFASELNSLAEILQKKN